MTAHTKLAFASVLACTPASATTLDPVSIPVSEAPQPVAIVVTPEPENDVAAPDFQPEECGLLDLDAWSRELEAAAPEARPGLLAELGLEATDPDFSPEDEDSDPPWLAAIHLRNVRVHRVELGGPPGVEQIVEVELAGTKKLDDKHARSVVQVFTEGKNGQLCRVLDEGELSASLIGDLRPAFRNPAGARPWGPQQIAFVELLAPGVHAIEQRQTSGDTEFDGEAGDVISYWALDEQGELEEIFWFTTFSRDVNSEAMVQIFEIRGQLRVLAEGWPRVLETEQSFVRKFVDEPKAERSSQEAQWKFVDGRYQKQ